MAGKTKTNVDVQVALGMNPDSPLFIEIRNHMIAGNELRAEIKEMEATRKTGDQVLMGFFETLETDSFEDGKLSVSKVERRGGYSWDAKYLQEILTPEQLERARVPRKGYSYIRFSESKAKK